MSISRRRFAAAVAAAGGLAGYLPERLQALRVRPKLFVFLFAEQFRQVYLDRWAHPLAEGGFKRLMEEGIYYPNCRMAATSFTAGGLATLATGAYPQLHGIVADQWYDRQTGAPAKARAKMLEATTLADEVARLGEDKSRTFCIGLQRDSLSLVAGSSGAQLFWMDDQGLFTASPSAEWLPGYNRLRPIENLHDAPWTAVGAGEGFPPLRRLTFDPSRPEEFMTLYQSSPFSQDAQFELLRQVLAVEKLGQGETLDFIFASLGSMALLGYETGSDSPLMEQMVQRLDRQIKVTLDTLDKMPGAGNYNLIFAAAHGAPPEQDGVLHPRKAVDGEKLARTISTGLSDWIDKGTVKNVYVEKYVYPFLYLKLEALRKQNVALRNARKLAAELALSYPGVAGYYTADGECTHSGEWRRRFENSFCELRSGDVMLSYEPGTVEETGARRGISYGSLYNYDTSVPLFLYGAQFGAQVIERGIELVDLAPTVARAAGLSVPSSATGAVLGDAFAEEKRK
jgi:predicted AlkP superfamily pyrophosphatase or phosphodiesterase